MAGERPLNMQRVNALVKPLIELSGETHYYAAVCARERIIRMQKQLAEKLKSTGALVLLLVFFCCDWRLCIDIILG